MRMRHLPPALHEKIVSFYQDVWIQKQGAPQRHHQAKLMCVITEQSIYSMMLRDHGCSSMLQESLLHGSEKPAGSQR